MVASLRDLSWVGACSGLTCIHCADELKQSICYRKRFLALKDTAHRDHTVVICTVGMKFRPLTILKFTTQKFCTAAGAHFIKHVTMLHTYVYIETVQKRPVSDFTVS